MLPAGIFLFSTVLFAQQVAQPTPEDAAASPAPPIKVETTPRPALPAASGADDDDIVEMSVFEVNAGKDDGYSAANSTSGSRVNTPLKDLAASISAFTPEFLDDIAATTIDDILSYAGNVELEFEDATNGFNNNETRRAGNNNERFRVRGIAAAVLVDGVKTAVPIDAYNMGRVEIASGANSILFGIGAQGGVVTWATNRANARRNRLIIRNTIGTWSSPAIDGIPNERLLLDYNVVLISKKMAFRLNGLYQNNGSWRYRQFNDDKRLAPSFMVKPFKNTTIHLSYESGRLQNATTRSFNGYDGYSAWDEAGRPVMDGFGSAYAVPGTSQINAGGNNPNYIYVGNNSTIYDFRQAYQAAQRGSGDVALDPDISSFYYSTVGPGGVRDQKFNDYSFIIEQTIGKFNLQLQYTHNQNDSSAVAPGNIRSTIRGDPNLYLSSVNWATATGATLTNPYAGQLYMQANWSRNVRFEKNDALILTGEYTLNLKKYGRHRIIGLLQYTKNELSRNIFDEILVDDNQVAINNPTDPLNSYNNLIRRNYLNEGDFTTYYDGAYHGPVSGIVIGDKTYHSAWVSEDSVEAHTKASIKSYMLAVQSYLFRSRLATTIGARIDEVSFKMEQPGIIDNPNDPRILDKSRVLHDTCLDGTYGPSYSMQPFTFSAGAVYHTPLFSDRFSLTANYSTNRGMPYLDSRTVLPTGGIPPLTEGRTFDYGIRADIFGNNKLVARLVRFDTRQMGDATITPNGIANASNDALGSTNLYRIHDAMFFLYPTSLNGGTKQANWGKAPAGGWLPGTGPGMGPMPAGMYAVVPASGRYPYGTPPQYNAAMVDVQSRGFEFSLAGRPVKNMEIRWEFSYSDRNREKIFQEIIDYYSASIAAWMDMADPDKNGGTTYHVTTDTAGTTQVTLQDFIWDQLYGQPQLNGDCLYGGTTSVRKGLSNNLYNQTGRLGARPWKTNLSIRYNFPRNTFLKGFTVWAAVRYQSPNYYPSADNVNPNNAEGSLLLTDVPPQSDTQFAFDPDAYYGRDMGKGAANTYCDGMIRYTRKIFKGRATMSIQLNVANIFDINNAGVGRRNADGSISRTYTISPRQFRLTTTFDF
jgi:outer membrane receptor protein involved in Fe transport